MERNDGDEARKGASVDHKVRKVPTLRRVRSMPNTSSFGNLHLVPPLRRLLSAPSTLSLSDEYLQEVVDLEHRHELDVIELEPQQELEVVEEVAELEHRDELDVAELEPQRELEVPEVPTLRRLLSAPSSFSVSDEHVVPATLRRMLSAPSSFSVPDEHLETVELEHRHELDVVEQEHRQELEVAEHTALLLQHHTALLLQEETDEEEEDEPSASLDRFLEEEEEDEPSAVFQRVTRVISNPTFQEDEAEEEEEEDEPSAVFQRVTREISELVDSQQAEIPHVDPEIGASRGQIPEDDEEDESSSLFQRTYTHTALLLQEDEAEERKDEAEEEEEEPSALFQRVTREIETVESQQAEIPHVDPEIGASRGQIPEDEEEDEEAKTENESSSLFQRAYTRIQQKKWPLHTSLCLLLIFCSAVSVSYLNALTGQLLGLDGFFIKVFPTLFQEKIHADVSVYCTFIDKRLLAVLMSSHIIQMIGVITTCYFSRRIGRKNTLLGSFLVIVVGVLLVLWLPNTFVFLLGFAILNFGIGVTTRIIPIIQSELAPDWPRLFHISSTLGLPIAALTTFKLSHHQSWAWRAAYGSIIPVFLFLSVLSLFLLESPTYMLERDKKVKAIKLLQQLEGKQDVVEKLEKLERKIEKLKTVSPFLLLGPLSRPTLVVTIVSTTVALFSAVRVLQFYGPMILESALLTEEAKYLPPVVISVIQVIVRLSSLVLVRKYGRKNFLLIALFIKCASEAFLAGVYSSSLHQFTYLDQPLGVIVSGIINIAADAYLTAKNTWLEINFPDESAEIGGTFMVVVGVLQNAIMASISIIAFCNLNRYIFFPFMLWDVLVFVFVLVLLPETTNIDIVKAWSSHWLWKKCVRTTSIYKFV